MPSYWFCALLAFTRFQAKWSHFCNDFNLKRPQDELQHFSFRRSHSRKWFQFLWTPPPHRMRRAIMIPKMQPIVKAINPSKRCNCGCSLSHSHRHNSKRASASEVLFGTTPWWMHGGSSADLQTVAARRSGDGLFFGNYFPSIGLFWLVLFWYRDSAVAAVEEVGPSFSETIYYVYVYILNYVNISL